MTDRLTPGMLRDLADLCSVGNRVVTLTANGETTRFYPNKDLAYVLREEAARREAEAKPNATQASGSCTYPRCGCSSRAECSVKDKPAPAAPAFWKGSTLDPECKPAPAADRNLVTDASTLAFKQLEAAEARVRELEAQILSHIQANDVSCKGWAAEKARNDKLAAAIRDIDRACNMAEVHRIAVDALASEGGRPNG